MGHPSHNLMARPADIAGLSKLIQHIGEDGIRITRFVGDHATPEGTLTGAILQSLADPLGDFRDATQQRMHKNADVCTGTATELNKTAWLYVNQETQNYAALNQVTADIPGGAPFNGDPNVEKQGKTQDYPSPSSYPVKEEIKLDPPSQPKADVDKLVHDTAGWLGDVNDAIKNVTGFDPLGELLQPIAGNWNELKRIGEVYDRAGAGWENCAHNLDDGAKRVSDSWHGRASDNFQDYSHKLSAGLAWEAPVGRVVHAGLDKVAESIKKAVEYIVREFKKKLEEEVDVKSFKGILKFLFKKVPFLGTSVQIEEILRKFKEVMDDLVRVKQEIERTVDAVKDFLDAVKDPVGKLTKELKNKLKPLTDKFEDAKKKAEFEQDVDAAADPSAVKAEPHDPYDVGTGHQPWDP